METKTSNRSSVTITLVGKPGSLVPTDVNETDGTAIEPTPVNVPDSYEPLATATTAPSVTDAVAVNVGGTYAPDPTKEIGDMVGAADPV